jgi:hypothetical protein
MKTNIQIFFARAVLALFFSPAEYPKRRNESPYISKLITR